MLWLILRVKHRLTLQAFYTLLKLLKGFTDVHVSLHAVAMWDHGITCAHVSELCSIVSACHKGCMCASSGVRRDMILIVQFLGNTCGYA